MSKQKTAFISLLKPLDDTRSYHKLALSLHQHCEGEIHLIGYPSQSLPTAPPDIHFHPLKPFHRLSFRRLLASLYILKKTLQLKPQLIVVNSSELLIVTISNKILFGTKIIYDIQENYFRNLWYQQVYPPAIKHLLALTTRIKETLLAPFFDTFILAEKCYEQELNFIGRCYIILENKAIVKPASQKVSTVLPHRPQLLFSGTITENTGIRNALKLATRLATKTNFTLHIVGHCPDAALRTELGQLDPDIFHLHISEHPIPYAAIETAISQADIGLICYQTNPSNAHCMPTKVYEYAAHGLPMIYQTGSHWQHFITKEASGIAIDFDNPPIKETKLFIQDCLRNKNQRTPSQKATWQHEETRWIALYKSLIK